MAAVGPAPRAPRRDRGPEATGNRWALAIFAALVIAAPLLFGAVDRVTQIALTLLFAAGAAVAPPALTRLSSWQNRLIIALLTVLVLKEFAPAGWFGATLWRTELTQDFALELPWTHHPEPGRAVDALLAGALGMLWFLWVRRLSAQRENRPRLAWILLLSGGFVAAVSFATRGIDPKAIYGLRYTTGWFGFGPFPNRNHSACFFAMAAVLGCGCVAWAGAGKRWLLTGLGSAGVFGIFLALLVTESRGGLVAFAVGASCLLALMLARKRDWKTLGIAVAAALVLGAGALAFGGQVFARFGSVEGGEVSNFTRLNVWQDTLEMWKDAPFFGHGLGAFAGLFPMYQKLALENVRVGHPESSWLQWLTELGLVPVFLAAAGLVPLVAAGVRDAFPRRAGFFLRAAGLSACATLLVHAAFDVPAHRWGTLVFALAALALGCPPRDGARAIIAPARTALVPLAIAIFWSLPLLMEWPGWAPLTLTRLLARDYASSSVTLAELENAAAFFPLQPELHQGIGTRVALQSGRAQPGRWQREFRLAARLVPASWTWLVAQARICAEVSPPLAVSYWQQAIERGGLHREDVLRQAVAESAKFPFSADSWRRYVEDHPSLLLTYAQLVPPEQARALFERWWSDRAFHGELRAAELREGYDFAAKWAAPAEFERWTQTHAEAVAQMLHRR